MSRPDWDTYFLNIAKAVSKRASCPRASSGVVLVKDRRIVATGYNGAPPGYSDCLTKGCIMVDNHCMRAIHGERNAIEWGEKFDIDFKDTIMYEYFEAFHENTINNYYPNDNQDKNLDDFGCKSCKELIKMKKIKKIIVQFGNGKQVSYIRNPRLVCPLCKDNNWDWLEPDYAVCKNCDDGTNKTSFMIDEMEYAE